MGSGPLNALVFNTCSDVVIFLSFFHSTRTVVRIGLAVATAHGLEDSWAEPRDLDAFPLVVSYLARSRFHFAEEPSIAWDASMPPQVLPTPTADAPKGANNTKPSATVAAMARRT